MASYRDLEAKRVLVTGANGGIGVAICLALAREGASVVACDLQSDATAALGSLPAIDYMQLDVASEEAVRSVIESVSKDGASLDCAVNAAAIEFETQRLDQCAIEDFDRMLAINVRGTFLSMKYQLRAMLAQPKRGVIVNIASTTSFRAGRIQPAYSASKHAVLGLTRQAALDYARDGIRINAIVPGNIDTPMFQRAVQRRDIDVDVVARSMPMRRLGEPTEIAAAVLWLCSEASSFTTGHALAVEGGMLLQ